MEPRLVSPALGATALVIAANEEERRCLDRHLRRAGCEVSAARSYAEGLDQLRQHPCDLVLLDLAGPSPGPPSVPDLPFGDVIRDIREHHANAEIICLSRQADLCLQALHAGAFTCLGPSLGLGQGEALIAACERALERTRLINENRRLQGDLLGLNTIAAAVQQFLGKEAGLHEVLARIRGSLRAEIAVLLLPDAEIARVERVISQGLSAAAEARMRALRGVHLSDLPLGARLLTAARPFLAHAAEIVAEADRPGLPGLNDEPTGGASGLVMPLRTSDGYVAWLCLCAEDVAHRASCTSAIADERPAFLPRDLDFAQAIGRHATIALTKARLFERVRQSQKEWERTFDTIPDAIAICDLQGRVVRGNRALREVVGLTPEDLHLRPMDEVLSPLSLRAHLQEALSTGGVVACEESPPDHGRTYAATISPIAREAAALAAPDEWPGAEGALSGAVVLLRDVTNEKRIQRRLLLGERMAAVGQLAAGLAHEINNPVSFAFSNLQMAKALLDEHRLDLTPPLLETAEMLDECMVGVARVRDIVRDLRTFTSTEVRNLDGEVRLDDIIDLALRLTRSEVQKRARLVYERDLNPTPPVRGDAGKLSHVLMNLLNQAMHNLPPQGDSDSGAGAYRITVRTRVDRLHGMVELMVADSGPTLSDEMRAHLFEPFAQRRVRLPPGVSAAIGLGLAVSYEVVRRHGGEIEARPGAQGGNELIVRLPVFRPVAEEGPARPARQRVLFIDDEPQLLRAYQRIIGDVHDITGVSSGREALELLQEGEPFDAIFCDLLMPVMDGIRLYRAVAARDAACAGRFIFLTGSALSAEIVEFLGQIDNLHVDKPAGRESLLGALELLRAAQGPQAV